MDRSETNARRVVCDAAWPDAAMKAIAGKGAGRKVRRDIGFGFHEMACG